MRIGQGDTAAHLSYCSNVHPGEDWPAHFAQLREHIPAVRDAMRRRDRAPERRADPGPPGPHGSASDDGAGVDAPFGIGLRLSARALSNLENDAAFAEFRAWLDAEDAYVFTINGFPFGPFHGEAVKADVYRPDWSETARLDYTCRLASLLARLEPPDRFGSISTLPGTFKAWTSSERETAIADNLLKAVAHCVRLERDSGVRIALAIEPEPCCLLETAEETAAFFETRLSNPDGVRRLATLAGLDACDARQALRRHLGVCHDVCHSAVEFESPSDAFARYAGSGVDVVKLQLSSALKLTDVTEKTLRHLARFDEPVYLHQVVERRGDTLSRHEDLGGAMSAARHRLERRATLAADVTVVLAEDAPEWRVHFHVPVFLERTGPFSTTRDTLADVLELQRRHGIAAHLEVETYTWDVLPSELRDVPSSVAIARELDWVLERL